MYISFPTKAYYLLTAFDATDRKPKPIGGVVVIFARLTDKDGFLDAKMDSIT